MSIKHSQYQEDIFEFVKYGYGNAVISAVAGASKTYTITKSLDFISESKKVLFLAFNNSIVDELKSKINKKNVDIKTLHTLGFSTLKYNNKSIEIKVDEKKYHKKLNDVINSNEIKIENTKLYTSNILTLINFGRLYMSKTSSDLKTLSLKYGLTLISDEVEVALELIKWSKCSLSETESVDFIDMLYLPNIMSINLFKYDFIFIDEAQDLSKVQLELVLKHIKRGGRFIAVGDENQSIYSFAGADFDSLNKIKKLPNTIELPLSICYRCPKSIVELAKTIVPEIEHFECNIDGVIKQDCSINDVSEGDMIICRNSQPLLNLYSELLENGINCYIKGKDIGINLINLVENTKEEELNVDLNNNGVFTELYKNLINYCKNYSSYNNIKFEDVLETMEFNEIMDKIECLELISKNIHTKTELISKIKTIFDNDNRDGVCLSTIHKAKGLEANNVFILNKNLIPSKFAKKEWEIKEERNLEYVAITRPKKMLGYIHTKSNNHKTPTQKINMMVNIFENKLSYGKEKI